MYKGDFSAGTIVDMLFTTLGGGVPATLAGSPVVSVYKDNALTQSVAGVTLGVDHDGVTGMHHARIDTAVDGAFYVAGSTFHVVITTGTVGGVSFVGYVIGSFSIEARSVAAAVAAVLAKLPAALVSGRIDASVGAMAANTVTAAAVAPDAVTEIQSGLATAAALATVQADTDDLQAKIGTPSGGSLAADVISRLSAGSYVLPPTVGEITDAVLDADLAFHTTPDTPGAALAAAGGAADPLLNDVPGSYAEGTAGHALASIPSIKANTDLISAGGVTVVSPYNPTTGKLTLVRGDDYPTGSPGELPEFTSEEWPDLTDAQEIRMTVRHRIPATGLGGSVILTLTDTESERAAGAGEQSVTFEPLATLGSPAANDQEGTTTDLVPGNNSAKWDIQATLEDGTVKTLASGLMDVLEDQTR